MRKRILVISCAMALLISTRCVQFGNSFERIDNDRLRLLDMVYEPAEAAPGDTVKITAVFAGQEVHASDLQWKVSYNLPYNALGADTALDIGPLEYTEVPESWSSPNTFTVAVKTKIPNDIMYRSSMIPENLVDLVPENLKDELPAEMRLPKSDLLQSLDSTRQVAELLRPLVESDPSGVDGFLDSIGMVDSVRSIYGVMAQLLTIRMRIYVDVKNSFFVESDYTVRYNGVFHDFPGFNVYANTNPVIAKMGVYKVKGAGLVTYDPELHTQECDTFWFAEPGDTTTEIPVEDGYSYFVVTEADQADSAVSFERALEGLPANAVERFGYEYFFELDPGQSDGVPADKLMGITNLVGNKIQLLTPPADTTIQDFVLWVQVHDSYPGVVFRPYGSYLHEVRGRFTYR